MIGTPGYSELYRVSRFGECGRQISRTIIIDTSHSLATKIFVSVRNGVSNIKKYILFRLLLAIFGYGTVLLYKGKGIAHYMPNPMYKLHTKAFLEDEINLNIY